MSRAVRDRRKLEEDKQSGYVCCSRKRYRNKIPDKVSYANRHDVYILYCLLMLLYCSWHCLQCSVG